MADPMARQIQDEIQKLKYKEPESTKLVTLEQELVRAEAQSLVAEAQLTNVTRQKLKEAYDLQTAAVIERAEKQILLAQQARRLLNLLDDTPVVPGEERPAFAQEAAAREILNDAEQALRSWTPSVEPIEKKASGMGVNAMPSASGSGDLTQESQREGVMRVAEERVHSGAVEQEHRQASTVEEGPPYPTTGGEEREAVPA